MRVLIVDDDEFALLSTERALTLAGYQTVTASSGREALDILRSGTCRLVIADWQMPDMDGISLCRAIRADEPVTYIYFILLTSRSTLSEKLKGLSAGADDFLTKSLDFEELIARVRIGERVLALETRDVALFAMAKLAESRDVEIGAHLERVRSYSIILSESLARAARYRNDITPEFNRLLYLTSPLHDIGKVGIPDRVLLKPGPLGQDEIEIMKTHTVIGARTLDASILEYPGVRFLRMARDIALTHHERYDGSGYPDGLAGRDIPLHGRIVALADVYDALTSRRVYKDEIDHKTAREMVIDQAGGQFDPDLVCAFVESEDRFLSVQNRFSTEADDAPAEFSTPPIHCHYQSMAVT